MIMSMMPFDSNGFFSHEGKRFYLAVCFLKVFSIKSNPEFKNGVSNIND